MLTRSDLSKAFTLMGTILERERQVGEIAIYGGSAIMLQMAYREATEDVDCVVTTGHGAVMKAMMQAGMKLGLPSGWLNEAVSTYASRAEGSKDFIPFGQYPSNSRAFLKVSIAKPEYILAMKIEALRRQNPRDIKDVEMIARKLNLGAEDAILEVHSRYFDPAKVTLEMRAAVRGVAHKIAEDGQNDVDRSTP